VAPGQASAQGHFGGVGRAGADESQAVRDAVDMSIDADARERETKGHDQIRRLAAYAVQGEQRVEVARHGTPEASQEVGAHPVQDDGFGA